MTSFTDNQGNVYSEDDFNKLKVLPRGNYFTGDLDLAGAKITRLPSNLVVKGNLSLSRSNVTQLPLGLSVADTLNLQHSLITQLVPMQVSELDLRESLVKVLDSSITGIEHLILDSSVEVLDSFKCRTMHYTVIKESEVECDLSKFQVEEATLLAERSCVLTGLNIPVLDIYNRAEEASLTLKSGKFTDLTLHSYTSVNSIEWNIMPELHGDKITLDTNGRFNQARINLEGLNIDQFDINTTASVSYKSSIAFTQLRLKGDLTFSGLRGSSDIDFLLPDYGLVYGNMRVPKTPIPKNFCCFGSVSYIGNN